MTDEDFRENTKLNIESLHSGLAELTETVGVIASKLDLLGELVRLNTNSILNINDRVKGLEGES